MLPSSPFKGLAYFGDSEQDWQLFFGRERESEVVAANLMASRLTVLYGPSGVGKSSLLRAGVSRRLRALVPAAPAGGEAQAEVVIVDSWRDDPLLAVALAAGASTELPLADALAERAISSDTKLYLLLHQMEEYASTTAATAGRSRRARGRPHPTRPARRRPARRPRRLARRPRRAQAAAPRAVRERPSPGPLDPGGRPFGDRGAVARVRRAGWAERRCRG